MKCLDTVYLLKLQDHLEYMEFLVKTLPKILLEDKQCVVKNVEEK